MVFASLLGLVAIIFSSHYDITTCKLYETYFLVVLNVYLHNLYQLPVRKSSKIGLLFLQNRMMYSYSIVTETIGTFILIRI